MEKRSGVGKPGANAISRALAALLIIATTAVATHADEIRQVAGHIPVAAADAVQPIAVIDRTDIELSGMSNVRDLLLSRLKYNSFGLRRPFVLGSGRVAILVNGRRISDSRLMTDLNFELDALPISAVERIEILSDSAAALHGGHAIAGAVNIVLKRDHEGVEVRASHDRPLRRGGDSLHGSALWGQTLERGHLLIGADVFHRGEIRDTDRDYSRASWMPGGSFADTAGVSVGGNTLFIPTKDDPGNPTIIYVPNADSDSIARALGTCDGNAYTGELNAPYGIPGTGCGFAWAKIAWSRERFERESLFLNLDYPVGEDADMYIDGRFAQGDTAFRYAPAVDTFSFTPSAAFRQELLQDPDIATLPDKLRVAHRFVGHGNRDWLTDKQEYDLTLGLRGRFARGIGGIGYDAHLRYYRHDATEAGDTFVSQSKIQSAIEEGRYNLQNPLSRDAAHLAAIRETGLRLTRDQITDHKTARASLDGAAFALGGGDARWAAGAEVAHEDWQDVYDYRDVVNASYEASDVLGSAGNSASGQRRRWSAFTEASLPLHGDWDVVLAGRRDDHDDVGATFSYQVASQYRLHKALAVRGSWSEGSRAPSLYALHKSESLSYPLVCDTKTFTGDLKDCDEYQVQRASGRNPELEPDEADSLSFGAMTGLGPFSLSADWFRIRLSGESAQLSAQSIINLDAEGRLPPGAKVQREGSVITRIESPLVNAGETDASGIDFRAGAGWKADWADIVLDARWLHVTRSESRVNGVVQPGDYPRDRVHASLRASRGDFSASWSVLAVSGYWNIRRSARYKAWVGHDITLRWRDAFGLSGMDLTGGVLNVGDRGPSTDPTVPGSQGADTTLDSVRGRTIFLTAKMSF